MHRHTQSSRESMGSSRLTESPTRIIMPVKVAASV